VPPGKRYSSKQLVNKQRKAGRDVSVACLFVLADHTLVSPTGYCTDYYGGTMEGNLLALPAHPSHCSTVRVGSRSSIWIGLWGGVCWSVGAVEVLRVVCFVTLAVLLGTKEVS